MLNTNAPTSEFCEWVQVGTDVYIPHRKYQVKLQSSSWFLVACAAVIVHRNHFFCLHQYNKSSESKVKFRLFNTCLKESCFPDCWKVSLVDLVFNNVG